MKLIAAVCIIVLGISHLIKPDFFRKGIWNKNLAFYLMSAKNHIRFTRALGAVSIVLGIYLIVKS